VICSEEFIERSACSDRISRSRIQEAPALRHARSLTAQLGVLINPIEEVAARFEEVDLVCRDESAS
jgi:hypothetical protein